MNCEFHPSPKQIIRKVYNPTGEYISVSDFLAEVRLGNVPGASIVDKFGSNANVGTTMTPITTAGVYQTPILLQFLEVLSSDVNDAPGGIGGLKVIVTGIGSRWVEVSEIVTLNGLNPVALDVPFYRVHTIRIVESGSYADAITASHVGTITVRCQNTGLIWGTIVPENGLGLGTTEIGVYTIPIGKVAYLLSKDVFIETNKPATIALFERQNADDIIAPYTGILRANEIQRNVLDGFNIKPPALGTKLTGPCDIGFMGRVSLTTAGVSVSFQLLEMDA